MKLLEIFPIRNIIFYFIIINVIAILMYMLDKFFAKKQMWRISEKSLIVVSMLGGSIGALIGMYVFHHKTKKTRFSIGIPIILIIQIAIIIYLWYNDFVI